MDRRDLVGLAGLALIDVGLLQLAGPAWTAVVAGLQLVGVYVLLERAAVGSRRRG